MGSCQACHLNECDRYPCACHCHDDEAQPPEGYEDSTDDESGEEGDE